MNYTKNGWVITGEDIVKRCQQGPWSKYDFSCERCDSTREQCAERMQDALNDLEALDKRLKGNDKDGQATN